MYKKEEVERIVKEIVHTGNNVGNTRVGSLGDHISLHDLLRFTNDTKAVKELLLEKLDNEHQRQRRTIETVFDGMNEILRKVVLTVDKEVKALRESMSQDNSTECVVSASSARAEDTADNYEAYEGCEGEVNSSKNNEKETKQGVILIDLENLKSRYNLRSSSSPISLLERRIMCIQEYLNIKPDNREMTGTELSKQRLIYNHYVTPAKTRVWDNRGEFLQDVKDYINKTGFWSTVTIKFVDSNENVSEKV